MEPFGEKPRTFRPISHQKDKINFLASELHPGCNLFSIAQKCIIFRQVRNVAIVEYSFGVGFVQIFLQTFAFVEEKTVVVSAVISVRQFSDFKQMVTMWLKFIFNI